MGIHKVFRFFKTLLREMDEDRAFGLAAEQAFYYMLSLFPLLILSLSILPYFSIEAAEVMSLLETALPSRTAAMIEENVFNIVHNENTGLLTFGIIGTIWSASTGINAFIKAMNQAFNVETPRAFWQTRMLSILLTFALLVVIILIFVLSIFGNMILQTVTSYLPVQQHTETLLQTVRRLLSIFIMTVLLCSLYYFGPNTRVPMRYVLPGAAAATVMWQLISAGFSYYVQQFGNYSATYGSLGGVIVLMLWLFLTGLTLVIGGEINAILHQRKTSK
ncbi:YihY/virulence factor BrkB family protein [Salibacterium halotolerans]|uniref:Membrane protein n=1 Tax=Salibacterium halotolerans TaxID=1884432 RepID=A0A1I5TET7_9BACI|nr:YihY/virulence factor BrkB family protein [Salibacterium halotolerans]SFP81554.1 membrane protein [Salibacterium halotolerans]